MKIVSLGALFCIVFIAGASASQQLKWSEMTDEQKIEAQKLQQTRIQRCIDRGRTFEECTRVILRTRDREAMNGNKEAAEQKAKPRPEIKEAKDTAEEAPKKTWWRFW